MKAWYAVVSSCITMGMCAALVAQFPSSYSSSAGGPSSAPIMPHVELEEMISKGLLARPHPNLYILGTVHIGSKSSDDVELLMEAVKPSTVIVEVPPSRLKRIQRKVTTDQMKQNIINSSNDTKDNHEEEQSSSKQMSLMGAFTTLPALASEGYTKGGISGLLFSTIIVWGSLLKRSATSNEENQVLPRKNEFETAIVAGTRIGSNIIPADIEFDDLIHSVATNMTPLKWIELGLTIFNESIGLRPSDPIRRQKGESMKEWEFRRRNVNVARASRAHGEKTVPELSKALVQDRDAEFARICLEALKRRNNHHNKCQDDAMTVCIVGLVHLDGIVSTINNQNDT